MLHPGGRAGALGGTLPPGACCGAWGPACGGVSTPHSATHQLWNWPGGGPVFTPRAKPGVRRHSPRCQQPSPGGGCIILGLRWPPECILHTRHSQAHPDTPESAEVSEEHTLTLEWCPPGPQRAGRQTPRLPRPRSSGPGQPGGGSLRAATRVQGEAQSRPRGPG